MKNIAVTFGIICRKEKKNQLNEAPLYIRLAYENKRKLISLKEKINVDYWDFENNRILSNCEQKEYLELLINEKKQEINKKILSYKLSNQSITLDEFIEPKEKKSKSISVVKLFNTYIDELFKQERIKNVKYYRCCLNCLLKYTNDKDIEFSQIDASFLTDYSNWMQKQKLHKNTIGNRLRGLKAIYNQAVLYKYVSKELYPFDNFKVNKFRIETTKRAITKSDIQKIIKLDLSKIATNLNYQYYDFARNLFLIQLF